jgi:hypothetical protein
MSINPMAKRSRRSSCILILFGSDQAALVLAFMRDRSPNGFHPQSILLKEAESPAAIRRADRFPAIVEAA